MPITGEQLLSVLDAGDLADEAEALGLTVQEYADRLAQELPAAADAATPHGELPDDAEVQRRLHAHDQHQQ
ncbi:YidB family protein [Nocardiopsis sediminis]|uniref:YidB family protein n=1 Tax=Nocardiopsis sediminis TaxID=1778267 RepID=A0ABV8FEK3_9ACTN